MCVTWIIWKMLKIHSVFTSRTTFPGKTSTRDTFRTLLVSEKLWNTVFCNPPLQELPQKSKQSGNVWKWLQNGSCLTSPLFHQVIPLHSASCSCVTLVGLRSILRRSQGVKKCVPVFFRDWECSKSVPGTCFTRKSGTTCEHNVNFQHFPYYPSHTQAW